MIGQSIAHYRVTAKLGEGGMGEVYRATDTKLHREVAIKVLPPSVPADYDRRARFEREAQVLAALNHPNIAAIYGVEEHALIMELVEGPTLADRIKQGPIPVDEAISIARQIAEALAAAHDKGIIHRDLKPANVKVTPDGQVKVLDFGLAKAMEATPAAGGNPSTSPTITMGPSVAGMILGTAGYMSPEQARGGQLDKRSDIWSFGVVLWEMLTGKTLFVGESISDTLAAVLKTDPDWARLPADTPAHLRHMLRRCLERDRKQRLRDISLFLEEPTPAAMAVPKRQWLPWAGMAIFAVAALILGIRRPASPTLPALSPRHFVLAPESLQEGTYARSAAISPDGKQIAYIAAGKLWIRDLARVEPVAVESSDGAEIPFWSADSSLIGFAAKGELKKVPRAGGKPSVLCKVDNIRGGAFRPDGSGVIFTEVGRGVLEVASAAGEARVLVTRNQLAGISSTIYAPAFLPGSNSILIAGRGRVAQQTLVLLNLEEKRVEEIADGAYPAYSPSGHIIFQVHPERPGIWALPFSLQTRKATGAAFRISDEGAQPSLAGDGTLVFRDADSTLRRLVIRDRAGNQVGPASAPQEEMWTPAVSPDGKRIAVSANEQLNTDIWIHDPGRQLKSRLTFDRNSELNPVWLSDSEIVYNSSQTGRRSSVVIRKADGSGEALPVLVGAGVVQHSWSASRQVLVVGGESSENLRDISVARRKPDGTFESPVAFVASTFDDITGHISPDGRFMAYSSSDTGRQEIYVRPFPEGGGKWQVSNNGGLHPRWSGDGRELFYVSGISELYAVDVSSQSAFKTGPPKLLQRVPELGRNRVTGVTMCSRTESGSPSWSQWAIGSPP